MKCFFLFTLLICSLGSPALAQTGQPSSAKNGLATWLRNAYTGRRNDLIKSAENVPDDLYGKEPRRREGLREDRDQSRPHEGVERCFQLLRPSLRSSNRCVRSRSNSNYPGEWQTSTSAPYEPAHLEPRAQQRALREFGHLYAHPEHRAAVVATALTQIGLSMIRLFEVVKTGGIVDPDLLPQVRGKLIKQ